MSNTETTATELPTIYTEVRGTTCYINGERGTVTGLHYVAGRDSAACAFVQLDDGPSAGAMLLVDLGKRVGDRGQRQEVIGSRYMTRDQFDAMTGLADARRAMGWRE